MQAQMTLFKDDAMDVDEDEDKSEVKATKTDPRRLVVERYQCLNRAVHDVEELLKLPILGDTQGQECLKQALLKCHFFNGNRVYTLQALCQLGSGKEGFGNRNQFMKKTLTDEANNLIRDATRGRGTGCMYSELMDTQPDDNSMDRVKVAVCILPPESELAMELVSTLLFCTIPGFEELKLPSLLQNRRLWQDVLEWCSWSSKTQSQKFSRHQLGRLLKSTQTDMSRLANMMGTGDIKVKEMRWILKTKESEGFLSSLVKAFLGGKGVLTKLANDLDNRKNDLQSFDERRQQLEFYVKSRCKSGVKINTHSKLEPFLQDLENTERDIKVRELGRKFDSLACKPELEWLYRLRESQIFLELWKKCGKKLAKQIVQGDEMVEDDEVEDEQILELLKEEGCYDDIYQKGRIVELQQMGFSIAGCCLALRNAEWETQPALDWLLSHPDDLEEEDDRIAEEIELRAAKARKEKHLLVDSAEDVELDQTQVIEQLIPEVKKQWRELATSVITSKIDIKKLEQTFKAFSFEELNKEMYILAATYTGILVEDRSGSISTVPQDEVEEIDDSDDEDEADDESEEPEAMRTDSFGDLSKIDGLSMTDLREKAASMGITEADVSGHKGRKVSWVKAIRAKAAGGSGGKKAKQSKLTVSKKSKAGSKTKGKAKPKAKAKAEVALTGASGSDWLPSKIAALKDCLILLRLRSCISSILKLRGRDGEMMRACVAEVSRSGMEADVLYVDGDHEEAIPLWRLQTVEGKEVKKLAKDQTVMVKHEDLLKDLFVHEHTKDEGVAELQKLQKEIMSKGWSKLTLKSISKLIGKYPMFDTFRDYTTEQLTYLQALGGSKTVLKFLSDQKDDEQFKNLIEVTRDNIDEGRLIAGVASLQHLRAVLKMVIYSEEPTEESIRDFLRDFQLKIPVTNVDLEHLKGIDGCCKQLFDIFHKQQKGESFKSVSELLDVCQRGSFLFRIKRVSEGRDIMCLELTSDESGMTDEEAGIKEYDTEHLTDLRSKLLMLEVSDQLTQEVQQTLGREYEIVKLVDDFTQQLQVLNDIGTALEELYKLGHEEFQPQCVLTVNFEIGGKDKLDAQLADLGVKQEEWLKVVTKGRKENYFLNFFTMLEILELQECLKKDKMRRLSGMLHLVSSQVQEAKVKHGVGLWNKEFKSDPLLQRMGKALGSIFVDKQPARQVPKPTSGAADVLVGGAEQAGKDDQMPVYVACSQRKIASPEGGKKEKRVYVNQVIDVILTVFAWRERLPEPGETLVCTAQTTLEQVEMIMRRCFDAGKYGRKDFIFVIADVHMLSYTKQCALVEKLTQLTEEYGTKQAATLLLLSGKPNIMILNALSTVNVKLQVIKQKDLRSMCAHAFEHHLGETNIVASTINGAGKTAYIMKQAAVAQKEGKPLRYCKIPFRESSSASSMLALLTAAHLDDNGEFDETPVLFHVDIAHVIPACANTVLFQLLLIGILRDDAPESSKAYHRRKQDIFFLEMANSPGNKTAQALRFCSKFLPMVKLGTDERFLQLERPEFDPENESKVTLSIRDDMKIVCRYIRAYRGDKLKKGPKVKEDEPISIKECYDLLDFECRNAQRDLAHRDDVPSFAIYNNFVRFMNRMIQWLQTWQVMSGPMSKIMLTRGPLNGFKHYFFKMLVTTSKDFTMRLVPQVKEGVGISLDDDGESDDESFGQGGRPRLTRQPSGSKSAKKAKSSGSKIEEAALATEGLRPPNMLRQESKDLVSRFDDDMPKWDESDHPLILFVRQENAIKGIKVLSSNDKFFESNITPVLKNALFSNNILDRDWDWANMTNEDAISFIHNLMGQMPETLGEAVDRVEPGYMITTDNLLKMLSIVYRILSDLPVIIMGETGCGKSSLITQLGNIINYELYTLNVHGGMSDEDILHWMLEDPKGPTQGEASKDEDEKAKKLGVLVFLDEVNTCNSMGIFKEMLCDKTMNGKRLPENYKLVAACNPYRLRKGLNAEHSEMGGLAFEEHHDDEDVAENVGTGIKDPLKDLVYRVHPLPEAMVDHVFDFGALAKETESLFIRAKLANMLSPYTPSDLWQVREALLELEGIGEAAVKVEGYRIIGYVTPADDDEDRLKQTLEGLGEWKAPLSKQPGSTRSENWAFKDLGFVVPTADKIKASEMVRGKGNKALAAHLWPAVITSVKTFQKRWNPQSPLTRAKLEDQLKHADKTYGCSLSRYLKTLKRMPDDEFLNLNEKNLEQHDISDEKERLTLMQLGLVGNPVDLQKKRGMKIPADGRKSTFAAFVEVFRDLIVTAQEYVRELSGNERSAASMRDVVRCITVYRWFLAYLSKASKSTGENASSFSDDPNNNKRGKGGFDEHEAQAVEEKTQPYIKWAVMLALAYCYQARLPSAERKTLRARLSEEMDHHTDAPWMKIDQKEFVKVVDQMQTELVEHMNRPDGIALNEALKENLFMLLVSVLNQIPIFVIGKPGSSKSLAMRLLTENLNGVESHNNYLRTLPAVTVYTYQCSPLSTSAGIVDTVRKAQIHLGSSTNTITIVLLDEVGLAEQSPHLPLKVLHKVLDEAGPGEALVGISNWTLDPAKMNRAVHLYRPAPGVEDLSATAEGMCSNNAALKSYLQALAKGYSEVYQQQQQEGLQQIKDGTESSDGSTVRMDFWGLREFYSIVKFIAAKLDTRRSTRRTTASIDATMLIEAVKRNFGGYPERTPQVLETFFRKVGLPIDTLKEDDKKLGVIDLIQQNVDDRDARHLMLLTRNNAALSILFDQQILSHDKCDIIIGSDFPLDQSDLQICHNIQRIKQRMQEGTTVILLHCEDIYESLYDLLNQHYTKYSNQKFVRLAFGTYNKQCVVHDKFRVICITEQVDAYTKLAPPLLNRFEKQVLQRDHIMDDKHKQLYEKLQQFTQCFVKAAKAKGGTPRSPRPNQTPRENEDGMEVEGVGGEGMGDEGKVAMAQNAFCGFHQDFLNSLALLVAVPEAAMNGSTEGKEEDESTQEADERKAKVPSMEELEKDAFERLLWCATPESVCRVISLVSADKRIEQLLEISGIDVEKDYFTKQCHSTLGAFAKRMLPEWSDELGSQTMVLTYATLSPVVSKVMGELELCRGHVNTIVLHELSSERDLTRQVNEFFENDVDGSLLVVQCDPLAASLRRVHHTRFICEQARAHYFSAKREKGFEKMKSGVHLMMLVHLPRGASQKFCLDFSPAWRNAFVDALETDDSSGLPSVEAVVGESKKLSTIVEGLKMKPLLMREFRRALSQLQYQHKRSYRNVHQHIDLVVSYLQDEKLGFVDMLKDEILAIMRDNADDLDLVDGARKASRLTAAGTFQAALHIQIVDSISAIFTFLLEHMDRNYGLPLLQDEKKKPIWVSLFHRYMATQKSSFTMQDDMKQKRQAIVKCDAAYTNRKKRRERFVMRFPFSYFLSKVLDDLKEVANTAGNPEDYLKTQFKMQFKANDVEDQLSGEFKGELGQKLLFDYVYDFTCMHCAKVEGLDRDTHASAVWQILLHGNDGSAGTNAEPSLTTLAAVHARYWHVEKHLKIYFSLVDVVPASAESVGAFLTGLRTPLVCEVHLNMLKLVLPKLKANGQKWEDVKDYFQWILVIEQAGPSVTSLLEVCRQQLRSSRHAGSTANSQLQTLLAERQEDWDRIMMFYSFVRDVAWPLSIQPSKTLAQIGSLDKAVRSRETFRGLLKLLSNNELFPTLDKEELEVDPTYQRAAYRFIQHFIFEICFSTSDTENLLPTDLLNDFVSLLAGTENIAIGEAQLKFQPLPSEASRVDLLNQLLSLQPNPTGEDLKDVVEREVYDKMSIMVKQRTHADTSFSVTFCYLKEGARKQEHEMRQQVQSIGELKLNKKQLGLLKFDELAAITPDRLPLMLKQCAHVRFMINKYAELICKYVQSNEPTVDGTDEAANRQRAMEMKDMELMGEAVNGVLATKATPNDLSRSMRMFLLKSLERRRGASFVREAMKQEPLISAKWAVDWYNGDDTAFQLFIGTDKLPQGNPLKIVTKYETLYEGVNNAVTNGQFDKLDELLDENKEDVEIKGALVATLFKRVYVMAVLDGSHRGENKKRFEQTLKWAQESKSLSFLTAKERKLVCFFAGEGNQQASGSGDDDMETDSKEEEADDGGLRYPELGLSPESTTDKIQITRVVAHLTAVAVGTQSDNHLMKLFYDVLTDPASLSKKYLPTMPQDEFFMITEALKERSNVRWKICAQCDYKFFISECGGSMETAKCPECKHEIGGVSHRDNENTKDWDPTQHKPDQIFYQTKVQDNSCAGYCLKSAVEEADKYFAPRELGWKSLRTFRMLLHAVLLVGCIVGGEDYRKKIASTFHKNFNTNPPQTLKGMIEFFHAHMLSDLNILKSHFDISIDQVCIILHKSIALLAEAKDEKNAMTLTQVTQRSVWEDLADKSGVKKLQESEELATEVEKLVEAFGKEDEKTGNEDTRIIMSELNENFDLNMKPAKERLEKATGLWMYRPEFTMAQFESKLSHPQNREKFKLLMNFVKKEKQMRGLAHLPAIIGWMELLQTSYARRLTRAQAQEMTVADVIAEQPEDAQQRWEEVFMEFSRGWNLTWEHVKRHGCLDLTKPPLSDYKDYKMTRNSTIGFSLVEDKFPGLLVSGLVNFMVGLHNEFVRLIDETMLLRERTEHREAMSQPTMKLSDVKSVDMLDYDYAGRMVPMIEKQCVIIQKEGKLEYDFATAEQYLLNKWLSKPALEGQMGQFSYLEEVDARNVMKELGRIVQQEPLSKGVEANIREELGGSNVANAQKCMNALRTCASFLMGSPQSAGPQHEQDGDNTMEDVDTALASIALGVYATETLSMNADDLVSATVSRQVQLRHLDSLCEILLSIINPDPTENVAPEYKQPLTAEQKTELVDAFKGGKLNVAILLPVMEMCMSDRLTEKMINVKADMKTDMLNWCEGGEDESYLSEMEWFESTFPKGLLMGTFVAVYRLLKEEASAKENANAR
jgi:MoxR-like ATPase